MTRRKRIASMIICVLSLGASILSSCGGGGGGGGETPPVPWTKQLGVAGAYTNGRAVAVGTDKSLIVAGNTNGGLDGNTLAGTKDIFYTKYDASGSRLYTRQSGTTGKNPGLWDVVVDGSNNVYVVGATTGGLDGNTQIGVWDAFLAKYDADGNWLYTKQTGSTGQYVDATGVATDGSGNVYVVGGTEVGLDGQSLVGTFDAYLVKYTPSGAWDFTVHIGNSGTDAWATAVASSPTGTVYVAGETEGGLHANVQTGVRDIFVSAYGPSGSRLYTRQTGSAGTFANAKAVAVDSSGNVYVAGYTMGGLDGNSQSGAYDLFLIKYDPSGTRLYTKQIGSPVGSVYGMAVATDSNNNVYLTGYTSVGLDGNTQTGSYDLFLIKYDAAGNKLFTKQIGLAGKQVMAEGIAIDSDNSIYVTGSTTGGLDGNQLVGIVDFFIMKFDANGNKL